MCFCGILEGKTRAEGYKLRSRVTRQQYPPSITLPAPCESTRRKNARGSFWTRTHTFRRICRGKLAHTTQAFSPLACLAAEVERWRGGEGGSHTYTERRTSARRGALRRASSQRYDAISPLSWYDARSPLPIHRRPRHLGSAHEAASRAQQSSHVLRNTSTLLRTHCAPSKDTRSESGSQRGTSQE